MICFNLLISSFWFLPELINQLINYLMNESPGQALEGPSPLKTIILEAVAEYNYIWVPLKFAN